MKKLLVLSVISLFCAAPILAQNNNFNNNNEVRIPEIPERMVPGTIYDCQAGMQRIRDQVQQLIDNQCTVWPEPEVTTPECQGIGDEIRREAQILVDNQCQLGRVRIPEMERRAMPIIDRMATGMERMPGMGRITGAETGTEGMAGITTGMES